MWAAIAGAAFNAGGTEASTRGLGDAIKSVNRENRKLDQQARDWDYARFLESRGKEGNALLPLYAPQGTETQLFSDTLASYNAMKAAAGTPAEELARYQAAAQAMTPAQSAGDALVNQLFSGGLEEKQVANIQPVLAARGAVAQAQKTGILEGLSARLNALSAGNARKGYGGSGSAFEKAALTNATIPAMQEAGNVGAQADLANATDVATLRNAAIQQRLGSLDLPLAQAQRRISLDRLPQTAASNAVEQRQALMNWFKMQPQAFSWTHIPGTDLAPNGLMILGATSKSVGSSIGSLGGLGGGDTGGGANSFVGADPGGGA